MTVYDEHILQQYADALYRGAQFIVVKTAVTCGFVAFLASALIIAAFSLLGIQKGDTGDLPSEEQLVAVILTAAGVLVGVMIGRQKAFKLKLEAQQILCQRQIEINTRANKINEPNE